MLDKSNVDFEKLCAYAKDAAYVTIDKKLPKDQLHFAKTHRGQPDVTMFDFTSLSQSVNSARILEKHGKPLLISMVGDSLLEVYRPLPPSLSQNAYTIKKLTKISIQIIVSSVL